MISFSAHRGMDRRYLLLRLLWVLVLLLSLLFAATLIRDIVGDLLADRSSVQSLCCGHVLMSSLVPFLIQRSGKCRDTPSLVVPVAELVRSPRQDHLRLRGDTLGDGNCGVHAFFLSLSLIHI